ncbi:pentapeptide repeat-containing protein [Brevibacillus laterosporus]|uniref:Secreted effector protein n=1 Tax=Brevibacillus laterosporus LMG 15441 TaxID=1042163 RepID=A0A075R6P2_BRELA|nr:pentapeptide repeat-containing protein [Brevibacillus laterosporus]AIG26828.1 secreted effector protein [Brevibacillus laterosporus LMG 15441]RJL14516.1 pentapeptide repeat-containing protein [Brevibacillus laterosporus]
MDDYLMSDCENCFGLCCVALPYAKSADFAFNKDGGEPCRNLCTDNRCCIHNQLRDKGFRGCVSYECFGAGQHVSQRIYKGNDWRNNIQKSSEMFIVFPIVQQLHEMLCYLSQALGLTETKPFQTELKKVYDETVQMTNRTPEEILSIDIPSHRHTVNDLLVRTSDLVRKDFEQANKKRKFNKGLDYLGANLKGADLKGANLRGALLIAANLSNSDLRKVDFIGADLRDADLRNANLTDCIFLTQSQVNSAKGNQYTKLPNYIDTPDHWLR